MSLKFGIYLVEQRIVTPEQFCGLIKIQQESVRTLAKISLQRNLLTIRQVANILDSQESSSKAFHHLAIEMNYLTVAEAEVLLKAQESTGVSIKHLVVECGLLTESQCAALYSHFERSVFRTAQKAEKHSAEKDTVKTSAPANATQGQPSTDTPNESPQSKPRQPNFKRRPLIIQNRQPQI